MAAMRIAYLDAFSGLSGDMFVGAFLDLGVPLAALETELAPLGLSEVRLDVGRRTRSGISATKLTVRVGGESGRAEADAPGAEAGARAGERSHDHARSSMQTRASGEPRGSGHDGEAPGRGHGRGAAPHRHYREIRDLLDRVPLGPGVRARAQRIFRTLALAESRIHGNLPEEVAFHEVGAEDAIVDVVGAAICLEHCGIEELYASPLPLGSGFAPSQHGVIPVPAPAVVELLRGFAVRLEDGAAELVTPTGAAIVASLATPGPPPPLKPIAVGYGAGERELADRPNLLRVVLAERAAPTATAAPAALAADLSGTLRDEMVVLEANIDDMNPEFYEAAVEAIFASGARDVSLVPLMMKKGRPGMLVQAIAAPEDRDRVAAAILRETSTIGVRSHAVARLLLPRTQRSVATPYGAIRVKVATLPAGAQRVAPEYDDCRRAAREHGVPVAVVHEAALRAVREHREE